MKTLSARLPQCAAALALCWGALAPAQAQETKIALFSIDRIYNESKQAKLAEKDLAEEFKKREQAVLELAARLKKAGEVLEKDMPGLSDAERGRRQRDLFELEKEYQRREREFREDVAQRTNEKRAELADKVIKIINQMAQREGFDIVLQDAVWHNPRIDITDKVLKALDK